MERSFSDGRDVPDHDIAVGRRHEESFLQKFDRFRRSYTYDAPRPGMPSFPSAINRPT